MINVINFFLPFLVVVREQSLKFSGLGQFLLASGDYSEISVGEVLKEVDGIVHVIVENLFFQLLFIRPSSDMLLVRYLKYLCTISKVSKISISYPISGHAPGVALGNILPTVQMKPQNVEHLGHKRAINFQICT